jgi:cysteinyl-tRNA synthetase
LSLGASVAVDADAQAKAAALDAARAAKDFSKADALRNELQSAGWIVETTKAGTTLRRA